MMIFAITSDGRFDSLIISLCICVWSIEVTQFQRPQERLEDKSEAEREDDKKVDIHVKSAEKRENAKMMSVSLQQPKKENRKHPSSILTYIYFLSHSYVFPYISPYYPLQ